MVGYEYEYRAAEPFFASEALEEEPEGIVDIGYSLVQFRVTGREFVLVLCRDDERVVRREGEQRGEERLRCPGELLAGELQERFVPNAPVTVEITLAVPVFVVFAADEPFDACRAGVCPESHRAVFRPAEECRRIPPPAEYGRQLPAFTERLRHQYERRPERRDAAQHRGHGLYRARAVGIHAFETEAAAHQRVEERREALGFPTGINLRHQIGRMLGRHALHDEDHDVAPCQVHRRTVCGLVHGREMLRQLFGGEIFFVIDASRVADRPQDAERVAQDEVRLAAVVGIEGGVRRVIGRVMRVMPPRMPAIESPAPVAKITVLPT